METTGHISGVITVKRIRKEITAREKRHTRIRARVNGTSERPRLNVFRSNSHIYAQVIDDVQGHTLAAASTKDKDAAAFFNANVDKAVAPAPEAAAEGEKQSRHTTQKQHVQDTPTEGKFTKLQEARLVGMLGRATGARSGHHEGRL